MVLLLLTAVFVGYFWRVSREDSYWGPTNHAAGRSWDWRPMLYPNKFWSRRTNTRWDDAA